jgi:hypothetical protein
MPRVGNADAGRTIIRVKQSSLSGPMGGIGLASGPPPDGLTGPTGVHQLEYSN